MNTEQRQCGVSYDLNVFTKGFRTNTFAAIKSKLLEMGLDCDFHPDAIKGPGLPSGFLPVRMKVLQPGTRQYDEFAGDILTGFEMRTAPFDFAGEQMEGAKLRAPAKANFFQRLFAGPRKIEQPSSTIAELLKSVDQNVSISCGQKHASELRIALYFAVALADVTSGVICDNYKGRYYDARDAASHLAELVNEYERSLHPPAWKMQSFVGWH